jgi:hypothetical protein
MLAARVEGALWVMADMGPAGTQDMQLFREVGAGVLRAEGAVAMAGGCPGIPVSLREAWG